ncbi:MAG: phosphatase PAP2 family protein [Pseudomonadota bacterium]
MRSSSFYLLLLAASTTAALVPALFPNLDIAVAAYFLQPKPISNISPWLWVELVNEHIPTIFRVLVLLCIPAWIVASLVPKLRHLALPIAFVGLTLTLGPGLMTTALKENGLRARPFHVTEFGGERKFTSALVKTNQCEDNCSFVSGHVACGFFFATLMLLDRRRRWGWVATGVIAGGLIGFARISVGAHWLSDVLWAFPVTLLGGWLVWKFLEIFYRPQMNALSA